VHLYTQIPFPVERVADLEEAGLDELRFHPPEEIWADVEAHPSYARLYRAAATRRAAGGPMVVGAEIPCIPGTLEALTRLVSWLDKAGFAFLNLNELEFSETNYGGLLARGFAIRDDTTSRVTGSEETARGLLDWARDAGIRMALHFCSSPFKDKVQLRERLKRRAERVARAYDEPTEDGTLLRGVIECADPFEARNVLARDFGVPPRVCAVQSASSRLWVAPQALMPIAALLPWRSYITEIYPTSDEMEVERTPLGDGNGMDWPAESKLRAMVPAMKPGGWS
jgi:pyruvate formate-lyase activating enzyme-like uncharacterized protein